MVQVDAIFAGFAGVLVAILIPSAEDSRWLQFSIGLGLVSLIFFALAAEQITDALDEGEVAVYLRSMLLYNVAVVLLFLALSVFLFARQHYLLGSIPLLGSVIPWMRDGWWLIFANKAEKQGYIAHLSEDT